MDSQLSILIVFGLGLATFVSPCVLPLLPSYLTFITGMSFEDLKEWKEKAIRRATVLHSLFFIHHRRPNPTTITPKCSLHDSIIRQERNSKRSFLSSMLNMIIATNGTAKAIG